MGGKSGALAVTIYLLMPAPAWPQMSSDKAEVAAARRARTCYIEMMDGQLKCGGRPQRALAAARALLGPGTFAKPDEPSACQVGNPVWMFKWQGFPNQAPIVVNAQTGKMVACGS